MSLGECLKNDNVRKILEISQRAECRKQWEICFQARLEKTVFTAVNVNKETKHSAHSVSHLTSCFCY